MGGIGSGRKLEIRLRQARTCSDCGIFKQSIDFRKGRNKCKECQAALQKIYYRKRGYKLHKKRWENGYRERSARLAKRRYHSNPQIRISHRMRAGINKSLAGIKNGNNWQSLVDYDLEALMKHLEKQFKSGMTWENYGTYWHIDHILPLSKFNFEGPRDIDFQKAWALSNLQPLGATKNISKHNRLEKPLQPAFIFGLKGGDSQ